MHPYRSDVNYPEKIGVTSNTASQKIVNLKTTTIVAPMRGGGEIMERLEKMKNKCEKHYTSTGKNREEPLKFCSVIIFT